MYEADARAINTAIFHLRCAIERELNAPEMHLGYGTFALYPAKNNKLFTGRTNNDNNNRNENVVVDNDDLNND